jgi:hypothetical protein
MIGRALRNVVALGVCASCSEYDASLLRHDTSHPSVSGGSAGVAGGSKHDASPSDASSTGGSDAGGDASVSTGGRAASGGAAGAAGAGGAGGSLPLGPWWGATNAHGCESAGVPSQADRPSVADRPDIPAITLALSSFRVGGLNADLSPNPEAWRDIGFDSDGVCTASDTCQVDGGPADDRACKTTDSFVPFDGNRCRDNELGYLLAQTSGDPILSRWFGVNELLWNCSLHRGESGVIIRISRYSGAPNDPSVQVDFYTTLGLQALPSWVCLDSNGNVDPAFSSRTPYQSTNHWTVARRSLDVASAGTATDLPNSKVSDVAAFVRGGYLFAELPNGSELWLNGQRASFPGFRVILHRGIMVGKLSKTGFGESWELTDGTIAGVMKSGEITDAFRSIGFCENMCSSYDGFIAFMNQAGDALSSTGALLPDTPCDGLSVAVAVTAREASATPDDIVDADPPVDCPEPRSPDAPRQGCICPPGGGPCVLSDGG